MRLRPPERAGAERRVDLQAVVRDEGVEVAAGVRDEPELQPLRAQLLQHGRRVLEQLEVLGVLPGPRHLDRALVGAVGVAAHAADDPLGEGDPDLLVVLELGMALDPLDRPLARLAVARRVELEAEALAQAAVALGAELRPGPGDREVDVEENCSQHHVASSSQRAVSTCVCRCSPSKPHAIVCADRPAAGALAVEAELRRRAGRSGRARRGASGRARASGRSARRRTRARRRAASGRSPATARARAARTLSPCRSWCRSTCSPWVARQLAAAPRAPRRAAAARTAGRTAPRSRSSESAHHAASSASVPNGAPAGFQSRGSSSTKTSSAASPPTAESGVPGTQRSSSSACSSGSASSSRIAPSPSQSSSAAASCSLSRCGCCTFSTACSPSAVVTGATSSDATPPANGSPRVSPRREIRRSPASGTRRPGGSSATAASRAPSAAARGRARP